MIGQSLPWRRGRKSHPYSGKASQLLKAALRHRHETLFTVRLAVGMRSDECSAFAAQQGRRPPAHATKIGEVPPDHRTASILRYDPSRPRATSAARKAIGPHPVVGNRLRLRQHHRNTHRRPQDLEVQRCGARAWMILADKTSYRGLAKNVAQIHPVATGSTSERAISIHCDAARIVFGKSGRFRSHVGSRQA